MECRKYVSDSCLKFIEVVRAAVGLESAVLHPIGLDYFLAMTPVSLLPYVVWRTEVSGRGAVAQLGERLICIQEVAGSIPTSSTSLWPLLSGGLSSLPPLFQTACLVQASGAGCYSPQRERGRS